jgi:hypothetical protein
LFDTYNDHHNDVSFIAYNHSLPQLYPPQPPLIATASLDFRRRPSPIIINYHDHRNKLPSTNCHCPPHGMCQVIEPVTTANDRHPARPLPRLTTHPNNHHHPVLFHQRKIDPRRNGCSRDRGNGGLAEEVYRQHRAEKMPKAVALKNLENAVGTHLLFI